MRGRAHAVCGVGWFVWAGHLFLAASWWWGWPAFARGWNVITVCVARCWVLGEQAPILYPSVVVWGVGGVCFSGAAAVWLLPVVGVVGWWSVCCLRTVQWTRASLFSVLILLFCCCEVFLGAWWMPWHQEPMKDVVACDKPRGVGERALIRGWPNGETRQSSWTVTVI